MLTSLLASFVLGQATTAATPATYVRSATKADGTYEVSTASRQLKAEGKPDIWLIGAIHVGSKAYYTAVQSLLDAQGTVLYEGVKNGPKPAADNPNAKPVYIALSEALGLEFQLKQINYKRPNWENVDVTWDEMNALNNRPGADSSQFRMMSSMLDPNSPTAKALVSMLGTATPGTKEAIKLMIVRSAASGGEKMLDPETQRIVLQARNKVVIDAVGAALSGPNPPKSIGIFYGALHLPDLQAQLTEKYGYQLGETRWFPAATADPKKVDATGKSLLDAYEKMMAGSKKSGK